MGYTEDQLICFQFEDKENHFLRAAAPPIYETAPFFFDTYEDYAEAANNEEEHYLYGWGTNPTVQIAEKMLAALEGGAACKCFASGMAAVSAALMCSLASGDHIILIGHVYESSIALVKYLTKFNVQYTIVHSTKIDWVAAAVKSNTRAILMESPTSFIFEVVNVAAVCEMAKAKGIRTIIDNSWATPLFFKPLELGVDIVVHSASKYLGGHNDLVAGAVIASKEIIDRMYREEFELIGASLAPFEAWLLIRGLRTLPLRMEVHQRNGLEVARFLSEHPSVTKVNHPGLPSHPHHELARQQLGGYAGVFSFEVSWGAMESQIISPNYGYNQADLESQHIPKSLIRLAVGLEPPALLIKDLDAALS